MTDQDFFIIKDGELVVNFMYEPPPPPEFRLYYDENGNVLFYTGEKMEGNNYLVIDPQTFAECRYDLKVIDGNIIYKTNIQEVSKLKLSDKGTQTYIGDINIIVNEEDNVDSQLWELKTKQIIYK